MEKEYTGIIRAALIVEEQDSVWPAGLWYGNNSKYVTGLACFQNGLILENEKLLKNFKVHSEEALCNSLEEADGCFALMGQTDTGIFAAVDRVCSIPVFYGLSPDGRLYVSERAESIRKAIEANEIDTEAEIELILIGMVFGDRTLLKNIYQMLPGQYLLYDRISGTLRIKQYFMPGKIGDNQYRDSNFFDTLDQVYERSFSRWGKWLDGRRVVLPLSGGSDSRFVAIKLKELGCRDVHCISYNYARRDWEIDIAREVADYLGFKWTFIDCKPLLYRKYFQKVLSDKMILDFTNYCSWPIMQEWAPLLKICEGEDTKDLVHVSGHGGAFMGDALPNIVYERDVIKAETLVDAFCDSYSSKYMISNDRCFNNFKSKLLESLPPEISMDEGLDWLLKFKWMERASKMIGRGLTIAPRFLGFNFIFPLIGKDALKIWLGAPASLLKGKKTFNAYVHSKAPLLPVGNQYVVQKKIINQAFDLFSLKWAELKLHEKIFI